MFLAIEELNLVFIATSLESKTDLEFSYQELTQLMQHCHGSRQIVLGVDINFGRDAVVILYVSS